MGKKAVKYISLYLMNHFAKKIPADKDHINLIFYGVNNQIEYSKEGYEKYKVCSQIDLCLCEEEDNDEYYHTLSKKKSNKSYFYQINHSLLEKIVFEFDDDSTEEIKIPLVSQKIYYDAAGDLHLSLAEAYTFPPGQNNDLVSRKAYVINYSG